MTIGKVPERPDFTALVAPKSLIKRRGLTNADLFRFKRLIGANLRAGITTRGDFILYSSDHSTWRKLVSILPMLPDFHELRVDPIMTKVETIEIVNNNEPIFA